jgi:hypothetical protein
MMAPKRGIAQAFACALLIIVGTLPASAYAQPKHPLLESLPQDIQEMHKALEQLLKGDAERDKAMLDRVLAALRNSGEPSAPWKSTLDRISLDVSLLDVWDPNARAMAFAGRKSAAGNPVTISQLMSFMVQEKSMVAARRMATHLAGIPDNYPVDMLLGLEGQNIEWHAMAWIIAHEIAHHRLGHTTRDPVSLEESRKWELDADRLGFEMLNDAGFSLYLLAWYFETMAKLEGLRRNYGLDRTPEQSARHPLWRRRYEQMRSALHSLSQPPQRWLVLSSFKPYEKGAPLVKQTFMIPDALDVLGVATLTMVSRGGGQQPALIPGIGGIERYPDGAATIYARAGNMRFAYRMKNRFAAVTRTECDFTLGSNRGRTAHTFYRDSFAGAFVGVSTQDLRRLFDLGGTETQRAILARTVPDAALRASAGRLIERQYRARQQLLLRYTRGDISEQEFTRGMSAAEEGDARELRALLGLGLHEAYLRRTEEHYQEEFRKALGK